MSVNFLVYGVFVYFAALFLLSFGALSKKWFKNVQALFVGTNILGFLLGVIYLFGFSGKTLVLAEWSGLLNFSPSLNVLGAVFFTLISGVSALVGLYAMRYLELYKESYSPTTTQFLMSIFVLGMQGVMFTNTAFSFLFFWEVMSIASFFLVLIDQSEESVKAGFLYFIMTHLGASAILGGFLILGNGSLTYDLATINSLSQALSPWMAGLAFALLFFGFGSKAGLVPFHIWLPEAHPQAPSNISALMSGLMLKVAIFGFIKVAFSFSHLPAWAGLAVIILGLLSAVVGVLFAVLEKDIKRAFAYSSIENMGIIFTMLGLSLYLIASSTDSQITAFSNVILVFAIFHAISHAMFKTALFLSSGVVINRVHSRNMEVMGGIAKIMPVFSFAFLIAILASLPLPPFSTFYGEWGFVQNIINLLHSQALSPNVLIVMVITLSIVGLVSGLAVFAMVKVFGISMLGLSRSKHLDRRNEKTDYLLTLPILILGFATILLGFFAKNVIAFLVNNSNLFGGAADEKVSVHISNLSSKGLFTIMAIILVMTYIFFRQMVKEKLERKYQTWDCGQPINATMEYTATAFSAPIRFFFLQLHGRSKVLKSEPIVETNPWIRKNSFEISFRPILREKLYTPIVKILEVIADRFKAIQGGRIQYYLLFVLGTLIITLIIFL